MIVNPFTCSVMVTNGWRSIIRSAGRIATEGPVKVAKRMKSAKAWRAAKGRIRSQVSEEMTKINALERARKNYPKMYGK